jgi:flavin reductase (DIM6/NTAB) family NADH-FMN oxidoreductase RutF
MSGAEQTSVSIRGEGVANVLRQAWSNFPTGVTVVTSMDDNVPKGITVNSFTSVSLEPPLVLVCIDNRSSSRDSITDAGFFGVHFLMSQQWGTAMAFARPDASKFDGLAWSESDNGIPLLDDFVVAMECALVEQHLSGDHTIMLGKVKAVHIREMSEGVLGFFHGRFVRLDRGTRLFPEVADLVGLNSSGLDW